MSVGEYNATEEFERLLSIYTCSPFAVAVDSCSNALFLSLYYENVVGKTISIPNKTYPSVPCEIIHAGAKVKFTTIHTNLKGSYQLYPTKIWDSSLSFTHDMYKKNTHMCLSFTGPHKHLKLGKGGCILTDDKNAYEWFKKARFSGRSECSYHVDEFDMLGWNFYMLPELSIRGIMLMKQFYNLDGSPKDNEDIELQYPDLSKFSIYET